MSFTSSVFHGKFSKLAHYHIKSVSNKFLPNPKVWQEQSLFLHSGGIRCSFGRCRKFVDCQCLMKPCKFCLSAVCKLVGLESKVTEVSLINIHIDLSSHKHEQLFIGVFLIMQTSVGKVMSSISTCPSCSMYLFYLWL